MHCHDVKEWLGTQSDGARALLIAPALQEHLKQCPACRALLQRQYHLDGVLDTRAPVTIRASISTAKIMQAVQEQKRITQQLEEIRRQQRTRMERLRPIGVISLGLGLFTLTSIPLFFCAMLIVETNVAAKALSLLSGIIDIFVILAQYLQEELTLLTHQDWLLSVMACAVVVMMGMWLRLMRYPQEV
jgi:predicted anti-sigma-YlaC factor YlaD